MKFHLIATIAIYFLFILWFSTLCTYASQEELNLYIHNHEKRAKIFEEKWKILSRLLFVKNKLQQNTLVQDLSQTVHPCQNSLLLASKNNILFLIVNQFATIKDILALQKTCKAFQNLLQSNDENMVTFYNYASKKFINTTIIWDDLKYFLKQNYYSAFEKLEMFNIKENQYAVLTRSSEEKIIIWRKNITPYAQILFHQATQDVQFTQNNQQNFNFRTFEIFNKCENAWARITKEGNVTTDGNEQDGGDSNIIQFQLKNVKMIFSTNRAFAALLNNNRVAAWGNKNLGGKIPDYIENQLQNVSMIFSTGDAFSALLYGGYVVSWGDARYGGTIPNEIFHQLQENVKMIYSTDSAFAALLNDGCVLAWGDEEEGGKIPDHIQSQLVHVKKIFSTLDAFAVLLGNGSVLAWGIGYHAGKIPEEIQTQLKNVKMIFSTNYAFSALLNNGNIFAWGHEYYGGVIPVDIQTKLKLSHVKIMISTIGAFSVLLHDGTVLAWGRYLDGGKIPDNIQPKLKNVKMIFSNNYAFTALLNDGNVFAWGNADMGGKIPDKILLNNVKTIIPEGQKFIALCKNGKIFTWGDDN